MARSKRKEGDPDSREETRKKATQPADDTSSDEDEEEEEEEDPQPPPKASKKQPRTPSKPKKDTQAQTKTPSSGRKSSSKPASKSKAGPTISPSTTAEEDHDDSFVSLEDDEDSTKSNRSSSSQRSSPGKRQSASSAQQITDLKQKYKVAMAKKSTKERALEKEMAEMRAQLEALVAEKEAAEGQLASEAKEKKQLSKKYVAALATVGARTNNKVKKNAGMIMQIKKVTKRKTWQRVKFIQNDKQLRAVALMVMKDLGMQGLTHLDGETEGRKVSVDTAIEEWLATYSVDVRAAVNDQRSYFQSEQKKQALGWLKEGKTLPTPEEFKAIAMRDLEDADGNEDPEKVALFDLYLLMCSACAGSATYGDKLRRTEPISTARTLDGKLAVPPGTEAMVLVMYENCYQKWLNMHQRREVDNIAGDIPKYSSKRHEETKMWMGKFSDSCSGNSPYGGWGIEGMERFNEIRAEIVEMRKDDAATIEKVEMDAVKRFSDAYQAERKRKKKANGGAEAEDLDEETPNQKRRRRIAEASKEAIVEFDDDE